MQQTLCTYLLIIIIGNWAHWKIIVDCSKQTNEKDSMNYESYYLEGIPRICLAGKERKGHSGKDERGRVWWYAPWKGLWSNVNSVQSAWWTTGLFDLDMEGQWRNCFISWLKTLNICWIFWAIRVDVRDRKKQFQVLSQENMKNIVF